ncbi:Uncharacterised protein [Bordetella pertussis]|nr:Uncharacterised protein [Bordetella pertussis]CFW22349.1 Uncharacterised protein [Bordetella pertussis]CFW50962.1 Uncharacterised protein [Bordetella pertussis]
MATSSLRPMVRRRISATPACRSKRHCPWPPRAIGTGKVQPESPTASQARRSPSLWMSWRSAHAARKR